MLQRIPKEILEAHYKIKLPPRDDPKLYTVSFFLQTFAAKKGWFTGRTLPNESQAAKFILKDYTTGKLTFCMLRPDFDPEIHKAIQQSGFHLKLEENVEPSSQSYEQLEERKGETVESKADESTQAEIIMLPTTGGDQKTQVIPML